MISSTKMDSATAITQARYQRISSFYDRMEGMMEKRFRPWREKIWQFVYGPRVLEVGVGTGKNVEFRPRNIHVAARIVLNAYPHPYHWEPELPAP